MRSSPYARLHSTSPSTPRRHSCKLATDGTGNSLGRVHISEEARGVLLNLLNVEAKALVLTSRSVLDTSDETVLGARDAANAAAHVRASCNFHGVGESDARRAGLALDGLVDVRGGAGGRLVVALEAGKGDVIADHVLLAVDAELVDALGAFEAAGEGVVGVDDLVGGCDDLVGGGEGERRLEGDWEGMLDRLLQLMGKDVSG